MKGTQVITFYDLLRKWTVGPVVRARWHFEVEGEENLPKSTRIIFVSNHVSGWDSFVLQAWFSGQIAFGAKKELFSKPIFGWMLKRAKQFSVDRDLEKKLSRSEKLAAFEELKSQAFDRLNLGMAVGLFPEGTRTKDGLLGAFNSGVIKLAKEIDDVIIIPVGIWYSRRRWRLRGVGHIVIGKPIDVAETPTNKEELRLIVAALSGQEIRAQ